MNATTQSTETSVVLIRHAQSDWNRQGLFTGWADPSLTAAGVEEARRAAEALAARGFVFDRAYASRLRRARDTARIVLDRSGQGDAAIVEDWRLNERHYGALQGLNKAETAARVGEPQVWRWRRAYLETPPALADVDPRHPRHDPSWADIARDRLPGTENLAMVRRRVMGFWQSEVQPRLAAGRPILVASHGNTLRALLMALDGMSVAQVESFEIPTGVPILYRFTRDGAPLGWRYLDVDETAAA